MGYWMKHIVEVDAPPERVYQELTTEQGLAAFWPGSATGAQAVASEVTLDFPGSANKFRVRLDELDTNRHVGWTTLGDLEHWKDTKVDWTLEPSKDGKGTILTMRHSEIPADYPQEDFGKTNYHWATIVSRLKANAEA